MIDAYRKQETSAGLKKMLFLSPNAKYSALYSTAINQLGLTKKVDVGSASPLDISWALVDVRLVEEYNLLPKWKRYDIRLMLRDSTDEVRKTERLLDSVTLADLGFPRKITFHIYPLPEPEWAPISPW